MDDLTFRKAVYANPFTSDSDVIKAAKNDPKKQAFWQELKAMEKELHAAMNIPVPENLAQRLILRQSINEHKKEHNKRPWYLALAASAVLATILTVGMLNGGADKFTHDVYAHVDHMNYELSKSQTVNMNDMNSKLASFNGHIDGEIGEVLSANYCYLDKIRSLHLIIKGEHGLTSLFVVPESIGESMGSSFSNGIFEGASFLLESAKIIVVGENKSDVEKIENQARAAFTFSA